MLFNESSSVTCLSHACHVFLVGSLYILTKLSWMFQRLWQVFDNVSICGDTPPPHGSCDYGLSLLLSIRCQYVRIDSRLCCRSALVFGLFRSSELDYVTCVIGLLFTRDRGSSITTFFFTGVLFLPPDFHVNVNEQRCLNFYLHPLVSRRGRRHRCLGMETSLRVSHHRWSHQHIIRLLKNLWSRLLML